MDQAHAKLLGYLIDVDGKLDPTYSRKLYANAAFTAEFLYAYDAKQDTFVSTPAAILYEFARGYYDTYNATTTVDAIVSEIMHRSELNAFQKDEINRALLEVSQFPPVENEFEYNLDRVIESHATSKALSVMQRGTATLRDDPMAGVEFIIRGLSDVLNYQRVDEDALVRTLGLSQFAEYLADTLYEQGAIMQGSVPYPYAEANKLLGGMAPGELIVIAGPSNSGKSFIGHDIAYNAALIHKMPTVCADREMLHPQNGLRFLSRQTQVPSRKLRNRKLRTEAENRLLKAALDEYRSILAEEDPLLFIPPKLCANTLMIRREIDKHWGNRRPKLIIADYLTEFEPTQKREGWEAVRQVTHDLKQLGLDYACPVVTMAQINRRGEVQYATIRHICDTLIILEEDDAQAYQPPKLDEVIGTPGVIHCVVDKARNEARGVSFSLEVEFATASVRSLSSQAQTTIGQIAARSVLDTDTSHIGVPEDD